MFGPTPKIDQAQPLYLQADQLHLRHQGQPGDRPGQRRDLLQQLHPDRRPGGLRPERQHADAEGNAQLKDPNGSITRADRFEALDDFRDAFVAVARASSRSDDTRIAAERASRREGNITEYERGKFTPCKNDPGMPPLWCISAARIIHDQQAATITYQDAQFELFGVPVLYLPYFQHPDPSVKRRSGFLMPSYSNSSTLGFRSRCPTTSRWRPTTISPSIPSISQAGRAVAGRLAAPARRTASTTSSSPAIDQERERRRCRRRRGWRGSLETKGQFSLSSWWRFGWDVTVESDDSFRRFYKLDPILQTDRVNTVYLQGMSDRNYFSAKLYQFGGLLLNDTALLQFLGASRSSTTTTSSARRCSAAS